MRLLFSQSGLQRLDQLVRPGILCAFDFDGTLAPIVTQPEKASLPRGILHRLTMLAAHASIAIVSGRALSDLRARVGFEPDFLVGNHGVEGVPGFEHVMQEHQQICRPWLEMLSAALMEQPAFERGIWVEDKGFSLSVHYRLVRDRKTAEKQLNELISSLIPSARMVGGKCVINLLPPNAIDKGAALEQLMTASGARSAIYVGDDVTDEDVFRLQRHDVLSVRVGRGVDSAAEFFLNHRLDMFPLLDELLTRLSIVEERSG
jgi:trehalose 6-phosphate phosphatase